MSSTLVPEKQRTAAKISGKAGTSRVAGRSVIEAPFDELTNFMEGSGKAKAIWTALRQGMNPLDIPWEESKMLSNECLSLKARKHLQSLLLGEADDARQVEEVTSSPELDELLMPCAVEVESLAECGTLKYLSCLHDGNRIESVIIPHDKYRTTLCVSTQVGCDRGCRFCATAKMGLIRNLTATEIISQVIRGIHISKRKSMNPLSNIVFMGMGDAGRNIDEVTTAVKCITDPKRLAFAKSKVCVSTVGPSPQVFQAIADLPCMLAWSVHAADDELRKRLVPSTQHSMEKLRDGLISALGSKHNKYSRRSVMVAATLIQGINDSEQDAKFLADFLRPILKVSPKIIVDLIPYNDINAKGFSRPSQERVRMFENVIRAEGYFAMVRPTRGGDDNAACGMLKTLREKQSI